MKILNKAILMLLFLMACRNVLIAAEFIEYTTTKATIFTNVSPRQVSNFNESWLFNYFSEEVADQGGYEKPAFDDRKWQTISVPHTWSTYETTRELHPYIRNPSPKDNDYWWKGWGWYRKTIQMDQSMAGKRVILEFDGVQKYCKVWLNGHLLGDHKGGFPSFYIDLTAHIRFGEKNTLAIAVNNQQKDQFAIAPMDAGNWNLYGGIYRDVKLVVTSKLYVPFQGSAAHEGGTFITTPQLSAQEGIVQVKTWIKNDFNQAKELNLKTVITDSKNKIVSEINTRKKIAAGELLEIAQRSAPISNPSLWSPDSPALYSVYSVVESDKKVQDVYKSTFGFRWFHWDYASNTLILNGKEMDVQGIMRHQEYPWLGDAIPKWLSKIDLIDIKKNLEMNFYRGTHYSQDPYVYDLCDSLGLMVCEDLPNVKNKPFSKAVQEQNLKEMIRRDRNHPSILFWGMGDETNHAANSAWAIKEDTTRIIHARAVVGSSAGEYAKNTDENIQFGGLLQCTVRGWYNNDVKNLEPVGSQPVGNEEWQHTKARTANPVKKNERIDMKNLIVWCYADHGCDREYRNSPLLHVNPKGWVDSYRIPKYVYYLYQANHAQRPMVFIHPHFWRKQYIGTNQDFIVDSNCDSLQLMVAGKYHSTLYPNRDNFHSVVFKNVPVTEGSLLAVGYKNGQQFCDTLYMDGAPTHLKLSTSHQQLKAAKSQVAIVTADIVDAKGKHVLGANHTITWKIEGPATLVGPERYATDTDKHEEMEGTMYIDTPVKNVIRATGVPGKVKLSVYAEGLLADYIEIEVVP